MRCSSHRKIRNNEEPSDGKSENILNLAGRAREYLGPLMLDDTISAADKVNIMGNIAVYSLGIVLSHFLDTPEAMDAIVHDVGDKAKGMAKDFMGKGDKDEK
jgi:hypothetical protein